MPVTSGETDTGNLTFTIVTELDATPERLWQMWADPRPVEMGMVEGMTAAMNQIDLLL